MREAEHTKRIAIIHYTSPPTMGGVESVILDHARILAENNHLVQIVAGRIEHAERLLGERFPSPKIIRSIDSQMPNKDWLRKDLDMGKFDERVESEFRRRQRSIVSELVNPPELDLGEYDVVFCHNVLTKNFNLPLTAALLELFRSGVIRRLVNWGHDLTWSSYRVTTREQVHPGVPWDLLRSFDPEISYVTSSNATRKKWASELSQLESRKQVPTTMADIEEQIRVVPHGAYLTETLGISPKICKLASSMGMLDADLVLLMPVRISDAKNIVSPNDEKEEENIVDAVDIVAQLCVTHPNIRLIVTGPPDPHDDQEANAPRKLISQRAAEAGLEEHVKLVYDSGDEPNVKLSRKEVGELIRLADVIFMPSKREGFGIPIVEAAMAGAVIVCSDNVPSAHEFFVDASTIFSLGSPAIEIARSILERLDQDRRVVTARRLAFREFTWSAIYRQHLVPLIGFQ